MTAADRQTLQAPVVQPVEGRLGVLTVGLGAVATTLIAGVELAKRGMGEPIGSLTQMGTIRLGKRTDNRAPLIKDFVPLADLDDIVFGAWDPFPDDAYVAAHTRRRARRRTSTSSRSRDALRERAPDAGGVRPRLREAPRRPTTSMARHRQAGDARERSAKTSTASSDEKQVDRVVMIWCGSTEIFIEPGPAHMDLEAFEAAIDANDPTIAPSMLYAYAALLEGVPFANGAPNLTVDIPALRELADRARRPDLAARTSRPARR